MSLGDGVLSILKMEMGILKMDMGILKMEIGILKMAKTLIPSAISAPGEQKVHDIKHFLNARNEKYTNSNTFGTQRVDGVRGGRMGVHGGAWGSHGGAWGSHGGAWGLHGGRMGVHGERRASVRSWRAESIRIQALPERPERKVHEFKHF